MQNHPFLPFTGTHTEKSMRLRCIFLKPNFYESTLALFTLKLFNMCDGQSAAERSLCQGLALKICPRLLNVTRLQRFSVSSPHSELFNKKNFRL